MKLSEAAAELPMNILTGELINDPEIFNVYACDLLSRVMSMSKKGYIWITVLTHLNVVAVAKLTNPVCILIPEGIPVPDATISKAKDEKIDILSTPLSVYEICWKLHDILTKDAA